MTWGVFYSKFLDIAPIAKRLVFKNMRDLIFVLNPEDRVMEMNETAKTSLVSGIFAGRKGRMTGITIQEILDHIPKLKTFLSEMEFGETEFELSSQKGTIYLRIKMDEILDNHGVIVGKLMTIIDVTEMKNAMMNLFEAKRMAALGGLVAGVAHEINTPVGVGMVASSALTVETKLIAEKFRKNDLTKKEFRNYLEMAGQSAELILKNLEKAARLVQSFKQVSVDQSTEQKRRFNVKDYAEDIIRSIMPEMKNTSIEVKLNIDDKLELDSYPGTLAQIITNLVLNSFSHAYEENETGEIELCARQMDGVYHFIYSDNEKGIAQEDLNRIFEPFFKGIGLGLHIVYNLVTQKLGGSVTCESHPGKGTLFHIKIPA
jgi:signal transduction histidine kinase